MVTTREAAVGQLIDEKRVVELPLDGRHAQDLVFLSAGTVNLTSRYCGFNCFGGVYPGEQRANVNGNGAGGVYYTLDGSSHNDTYLTMNLPFPNPDAVQEFKLQENNLSAVYGSSGSGVVNIVTKSGTNTVHGTIFEFLRNGALNARNYFAPAHDNVSSAAALRSSCSKTAPTPYRSGQTELTALLEPDRRRFRVRWHIRAHRTAVDIARLSGPSASVYIPAHWSRTV